jgi:DNA-binding MarR family transcriptional regulator
VGDTRDAKGLPRLTVKEKLVLQLGEYSCDPDRGEYPAELTQKGLSESLGVRRSHIAVSLQGLVEEDLVYFRKTRIEGEKRKQNSYALTPAGYTKARDLKTNILATQAEYEMPDGVRRTTAEEFLGVSKANLISVVNQLETGKIIRDEITIITRPERKLIKVFCPTCKQNMEVENIFVDEEVGFDCPGCGRPYRIAPAERVVVRPATNATRRIWYPLSVFLILAGSYIVYRAAFDSIVGGLIVASVAILLISASYLASTIDWKGMMGQNAVVGAKIATVSILFGTTLVILWDAAIIRIDFIEELSWFSILVSATVLGYVGMTRVAPDSKGEYLLAVGLLSTLIAASLISVDDFTGLGIPSAPFMGVLGVTLLALSSLGVIDRNLMLLSAILSTGLFVMIIAALELLPNADSVLSKTALGGFVLLGAFMISLRFVQHKVAVPLGEFFISTVPFAGSTAFIVLGLFMVVGGSDFTGAIEILIMLPFAYFGVTRIFDSEWMYKLPIATYLVFLETIGFALAFMT